MVTETRQAPRVARSQTNMADASAAIRAAACGDGAKAILDFQIRGIAPFGGTPLEAAQVLIDQVSAITSLLAAAYDDVDTAQRAGVSADAVQSLRGATHAQALEGITSLASLAAFFLAQHRGAL